MKKETDKIMKKLIEKYKEILDAIESNLITSQDIDAKLILKSSKVVIEEIIQDLESLESEVGARYLLKTVV